MFLILLQLYELDFLEEIFKILKDSDVRNITVLPGITMTKIEEKQALQEDFPIIPAMEDIMENDEEPSRTIICVAPNQDIVDRLYEKVTGILNTIQKEEKGLFLVLPVSIARKF